MKAGRSIVDLAAEIQRQSEAKTDYLADQGALRMSVGATDRPVLAMEGGPAMQLKPLASRQLAERLKIPRAYWDRMEEQDLELLATNANAWFARDPETQRMLRTMDNTVRAVLSNRYQPLDNDAFAEAALPILRDVEAEIVSCEITDQRLYLKATLPQLEREMPIGLRKVNDIVRGGVSISNSEVGLGGLDLSFLLWQLSCTNGMISQRVFRRVHLGAAFAAEGVRELMSDDTKRASDAAVWMTVGDVLKQMTSGTIMDQVLARVEAAQDRPIDKSASVPKVIEMVAQRVGVGSKHRDGILQHLIMGGELSQWGVVSAITRHSQDVDSYDEATSLETAGGRVLELNPSEWTVLAEAA